MNPPGFLFLHVGSECNLACSHCLFWMSNTRRDPNRISVQTMDEVIREFSTLNPDGKVVVCGGEPMLEYERYMAVCQSSRRRGLRVFSATNGYGIHSDDRAADLLANGPHEFTISLDSHLPDVHDAIRGRAGSYETAVRSARRLLAAREKLGLRDSRIYFMVLLTSATYDHLRDLYQLVLRDIGADKLKVNGLQPSFGVHSGVRPSDEFFERYSQLDVSRLRDELAYCNTEFDLGLDLAWVAQTCRYYEDLHGRPDRKMGWDADIRTRDHICNCYDRNIVVGLYGEMGHCYSFSNFQPSAYRRFGDLARFWDESEQRDRMRDCNRLCAIGHSNRNLSATLRKPDVP